MWSPPKCSGETKVGMLHQRQEWVAGALGQVVPVIALLGELVFERQGDYHRAHRLHLAQPVQVFLRQGRHEPAHCFRRERDQHLVILFVLLAVDTDRS